MFNELPTLLNRKYDIIDQDKKQSLRFRRKKSKGKASEEMKKRARTRLKTK